MRCLRGWVALLAIGIASLPACKSQSTDTSGASSASAAEPSTAPKPQFVSPDQDCRGGRCLTTFASGQAGAGDLVMNETNVYWTAVGGLMSAPKAGGGPVTVLVSGPVSTLAVDGASVFWATEGTEDNLAVMRLALQGGSSSRLALQTGRTAGGRVIPSAMALDASNVYWGVSVVGEHEGPDPAVMRTPKGGGTPETLAMGHGAPARLAVDSTNVYWTADTEVLKVPLRGGTPSALAVGQDDPMHIAIDSSYVYWTSGGNGSGRISKVPLRGGRPTILVSGQGNIWGFAVDGTNVYWTNRPVAASLAGGDPGDDGSVLKLPVGGGTPTVLATHQRIAPGVIVDATSVYWSTSPGSHGSATEWKIMKLTPK